LRARTVPEVEACCTRLARREQFVGAKEPITWPDGTVASGFRFHHALYQETLYRRLPAGHRVEAHWRIAQREEAAFGARAGEIAAELADHYKRCGDLSKVFTYLVLAGERAVARRAYREAEYYYRNAISALCTLPESTDRDKRELSVQIALGNVAEATRGWSARETVEIYRRAALLVESGGVESLEVSHGQYSTAITRGELRLALAVAGKMLETARKDGDSATKSSAHYAQALPHYYLGQLHEAQDHFIHAIEEYHEEDFHGNNSDPGVSSRVFLGSTEWQLGRPDRALRYVDETISFTRRCKPALSLAFALSAGSYVYAACDDIQRVLGATEEAMRLSKSLEFPLQYAIAKIRNGWALVKIGKTEGLERILQGLSEFDQINFHLARSSFLGYLCEAQMLAGNLNAALAAVEQALEPSHGELIFRPELLRLLGELRLKKEFSDDESVNASERCFREAIGLAQSMEARSWELRATTSLARLLASQGNRDEARTRLAEIYNWFTEGFDTRDLKEAKALLEELS
jgi:tetratricopeptide (TPR) repeat protein